MKYLFCVVLVLAGCGKPQYPNLQARYRTTYYDTKIPTPKGRETVMAMWEAQMECQMRGDNPDGVTWDESNMAAVAFCKTDSGKEVTVSFYR